jgi:hypothetical protein
MPDRISAGYWFRITLTDSASPRPSWVAPFRRLFSLFDRPATYASVLPMPALEPSSDQPSDPIDEYWREPHDHHDQPRQCPSQAAHRPRPLPAGPEAMCAKDGLPPVSVRWQMPDVVGNTRRPLLAEPISGSACSAELNIMIVLMMNNPTPVRRNAE